ncbi:MAG: GNAT family N-acetyltransferase [Clostridia bacterium]|nr:GNAT family N-acetyltransferase [Clostridia bacterium]
MPRLRGTGLAAALLGHAEAHEAARGAEYLWVEHGTANPCARGFWNKHFATTEYEMTRRI